MWCRQCRQDVPGLHSGSEQSYTCPRCGTALCAELPAAFGLAHEQPSAAAASTAAPRAGNATVHPAGHQRPPHTDAAEGLSGTGVTAPHQAVTGQSSDPAVSRQSLGFATVGGCRISDWEQEAELLELGHALRAKEPQRRKGHLSKRHARHDPPHPAASGWHAQDLLQRPKPHEGASWSAGLVWLLAWTAISIGLMAVVCGGVLAGWSILGHRNELWDLGVPIALVGQVAMLLGLVLQLDRLWLYNRSATAKLDQVDNKLRELKQTTTLLGTGQGTPAAFYAHFAEGASPKLLLSDLKSQLDLLALKLSNEQQ